MSLKFFFLSWTPVLLLMVLSIFFRWPALHLSLAGVAFTSVLAWWYFATPLEVIFPSALDGVVTTVPLLLVVSAGILLSNVLTVNGAISRLVTWFVGGLRRPEHRHVFITLGVANFLEGASVIAEPLVAPMLLEAGVGPAGAAALSIIGYAGLMSVEMAGIIITVLALVTGLPYDELGSAAAWLSVPATLAMAAAIPCFLPKGDRGWPSLPFMLGNGLMVSFAALAVTLTLGVTLAGALGGLGLMLLLLLRGQRRWSRGDGLWRDFLPFVMILVPLLLVNSIPWLHDLTSRRLVVSLGVVPIHQITLTPFYSAYLYLFLALGLALLLRPLSRPQLRQIMAQGLSQGWRAGAAMALFGAMGQIISYTGYSSGFGYLDKTHNIPYVLATGLKTLTGEVYPVFVPLLGWVGTFLTGYGVASLMLFGELQVQAAGVLQTSAVWLAAALTVGASVGSISSPFKIAIATSMCRALGQEGDILRRTIPLGVAACFLLGVTLWLIALGLRS